MEEFDPAELPQSLIELSETLTTIREGQAAGKEYYENKFDLTECPLNKDKKQILKTAIIRAMFESQTTSNSGISQTVMRSITPNINRKEALLLGNGIIPLLYESIYNSEKHDTAAVYIDLSFSTEPYHKEICKILTALREVFRGPYYAFTDSVEELSYSSLLRGEFKISDTEINPVIDHINKKKFNKALIITDGEFAKAVKTTKADLFVVLFEEHNNARPLLPAGNIKNIWYLAKYETTPL